MGLSETEFLIHAQFDRQARRTPDGVALHEGDESITYRELDVAATRVANALRLQEAGPGSIVGLYFDRSINWVIALLGVLKAGAAALPMPTSLPHTRLKEIVSYASVQSIIDGISAPFDTSIFSGVVHIEDLLSHTGDTPLAATGQPQQTAFVLSSSGSTGKPKLIVRSHRSFFHRLNWTWNTHPYAEGEVCCQKAHLTTTHSIYELLEPLLRGLPVVLVPDATVRDFSRFWELLQQRNVSRLLLVPSVLLASLDMPGFRPPPLKVVVLMGEYVSPELAARALAAFPKQTKLYSIYGSTEASSTFLCDLRALYRDGEQLPLGVPISHDVQFQVLNATHAPVMAGESGRLYIGGAALFSEYLNDPEGTRAVFLANAADRKRFFDTRDDVRLLPDGGLQFAGRVDHTVKIRGFRVNTQEVEGVLRQHPNVADAAVVVSTDTPGQAMLFGFVTPANVNRNSIFDFIKERLADYMVPSVLVAVDAFPLTASSKVNRLQLLEDAKAVSGHANLTRELTDTEQRVSAAWASVLGHTHFRPDDSFFEVGGTSLVAFALALALQQEFGIDADWLGGQLVYIYPSVESLASVIDANQRGAVPSTGVEAPAFVRLRSGMDPAKPPLFLIASAGGTLGAYEKLASALETSREIVGIRDPFLWGGREPTEGFQKWVGRYLEAIKQRQAEGPYYICAYSSAAAFGYEAARQLRESGERIALLVLIDPLALDRRDRWRYGYWALRATGMRPVYRWVIQLAGLLRVPFVRLLSNVRQNKPRNDHAWTKDQFRSLANEVTRDKDHIANLSALLELNTGLPFRIDDSDFADVKPNQYLSLLQERVASLVPEFDRDNVERLVVQYQLQVRTQHSYELQRLDVDTILIEPQSHYAGIVTAQFRAHVPNLRSRTLNVGSPSERNRSIAATLGSLDSHYRCMRDDSFVAALAAELDSTL